MIYDIFSAPGTLDMRGGSRIYTSNLPIAGQTTSLNDLKQQLGTKIQSDTDDAGRLRAGPCQSVLSRAFSQSKSKNGDEKLWSGKAMADKRTKLWYPVE